MGARARRAGLDPDGSFRACVVRRRRPLRGLRFNLGFSSITTVRPPRPRIDLVLNLQKLR